MISSKVVPPSRFSISITWLILLFSRGVPMFAILAAAGAIGAATAFLRASHFCWLSSGDNPSKARARTRTFIYRGKARRVVRGHLPRRGVGLV